MSQDDRLRSLVQKFFSDAQKGIRRFKKERINDIVVHVQCDDISDELWDYLPEGWEICTYLKEKRGVDYDTCIDTIDEWLSEHLKVKVNIHVKLFGSPDDLLRELSKL